MIEAIEYALLRNKVLNSGRREPSNRLGLVGNFIFNGIAQPRTAMYQMNTNEYFQRATVNFVKDAVLFVGGAVIGSSLLSYLHIPDVGLLKFPNLLSHGDYGTLIANAIPRAFAIKKFGDVVSDAVSVPFFMYRRDAMKQGRARFQ